jgi:carboxylesterase type B
MTRAAGLLLLLVCLVPVCLSSGISSDTVVTKYGTLKGTLTGRARTFRGVPFANPPTGANRWQPPQALTPWKGTKTVYEDAPGCPQPCSLPPGGCPPTTSEDCLYMNIITPDLQNGSLPVMVFVHGGNFKQGYAGGMGFDAEDMANKTNTIMVFVQYRLGALGYLVTNSLTGNYGIHDQIAALDFVQETIKAFGGDPSRVTLLGQSAGAASVAIHLTSRLSDGLFSQAIMESWPVSIPMRDKNEAMLLGQSFANFTGCAPSDTTCLRALSADAVVAAQVKSANNASTVESGHLLEIFMPWEPTVGVASTDLTAQPLTYFQSGNYKDIPIMAGTVSEEAVVFIFEGFPQPMSEAEYILMVTAIFGWDAVSAMLKYPLTNTTDTRMDLSTMATDYVFVCPQRNLSSSIAAHSKLPTYVYQYSHLASFGEQGWGPNYTCCWEHVCHAAELPFVFHTLAEMDYNYTEEEDVLSRQMMYYWTNFAHSGDPNTGPNPVQTFWPSYNAKSRTNINFDTPDSTTVTNLRKTYCDFWDGIGYAF